MDKFENKFSNKAISHLLKSVAVAYELKKDNRFKIIAYERAAEVVEYLSDEIIDVWKAGKLTDLPGIGPSIAEHLDEYFKKGSSQHFNRVLSGIPSTVFILMNIHSIGPKKAYRLTKELDLFNDETVMEDLKKAALENQISKLEGFGEKSQAEILEAIVSLQKVKNTQERMPLPYANQKAFEIIEYLKKSLLINRADVLGSLRRMVSTIGDIDIAVVCKDEDIKKVIDYFIKYPKAEKVDNAGEKKASIIIHPNIRVDLRVQDEQSYGSMLQYFTGSKAHNINLREYALKKGYSLSEYGITDINQKSKIKNQNDNLKIKNSITKFNNEKSFYNFLGLEYIPPEIREGTDEVERAENKTLPKLVELKDIKGDLHTHSNYDLKPSHDLGTSDYSEIAIRAKQLGYEYVGFSEHNPNLSHNSSDDINRIMEERKVYIDKVMSSKKIERSEYFIGIEADILSDGSVALPKESTNYLDYVIIGVHSSFKMDINKMTQRVLNALEFPKVKILSHPTGRILNKREGIRLDWQKIFSACKKKNIALEINAWPDRLDLPDTLVRQAISAGVKLCVNTDAHILDEMNNMFFGVEVARRGWATKNAIINTLSFDEFKNWIKRG